MSIQKAKAKIQQLFKGFSKIDRKERYTRLESLGLLTPEEIEILEQQGSLTSDLAEKFVENVIGSFPLPLGVAVNFCIDDKDYVIPMAVEETSIIAAASKTARFINDHGTLTTKTVGHCHIGQVQIATVKDFAAFEKIINANKQKLIADINQQVTHGLVKRGGGTIDLIIRKLPREDGKTMAVIHLLINTCDAMGANIINQACEYLKAPIKALTGETVSMCILSNLSDSHLTEARIELKNIDPLLGKAIEEASIFAETDPYRATTNNKGVLNGIDPVIVATGNDWRAVEAGIHAYACRDGQYRSITKWRYSNNILVGTFLAPIMVGIVGGVTRLHPVAKICLKMLNVDDAYHLARIMAACGLVQNLGAIRALVTEGIIRGHMKLHIANLIMATDANEIESVTLREKLETLLNQTDRVSMSHAEAALTEIRTNHKNIKKIA